MSSHIARVSLRYRPGADVLSGEIDLRALGVDHSETESPDADSTMLWSSAPDDSGESAEYLASFQFVHASSRLAEHTLPLPAGLLSWGERIGVGEPRVIRASRDVPFACPIRAMGDAPLHRRHSTRHERFLT